MAFTGPSQQINWGMQSNPRYFPDQARPPVAPGPFQPMAPQQQPGWWQQMMQRFQGGAGGGGPTQLTPQTAPQGQAPQSGLGGIFGGGGPPSGPQMVTGQQGQSGGLGGLFGGGGQPGQLNPMTMGLLGLGGGLMGAAGPSRIPVGLGQGLTQGMMGGLGGMMTANSMNRQAERDKVVDEILRKQLGIGGQQMAGASDISGPLPQQSTPPPGWNTPQAGGPVMRQPVMPANMPQRGGPIRRYPQEPWNTPQAPLRMAGMPTAGGYY